MWFFTQARTRVATRPNCRPQPPGRGNTLEHFTYTGPGPEPATRPEILADYADLEAEDSYAALAYAARLTQTNHVESLAA